MKQVNEELDRERKNIKREAKSGKNTPKKEQILAGLNQSKYALLKNVEDLDEAQKAKLKEVKEVSEKLDKMHSLKENFRTIFELGNNWVEGLLGLADWCVEAHLLGCISIRK